MNLFRSWRGKTAAESPPAELPLKEIEKKQVQDRAAPRAAVIYEAIRIEGEDELKRSSSALFWSGLAAGLSMGFSLVSEGLLRSQIPDVLWRPVIVKFGYSVGFLIVILGRQQLFTENTLTPVLPFLRRPTLIMLARLLRLWAIVLVANLAGAFAFAYVVGNTQVFDENVRSTFTTIGLEATKGEFYPVLLKAIFAGWIIALMVWLLPGAESSRVWVIIILTYLVGLARLSHIIAGSVESFYVVVTGALGWSDFLTRFFIPTLIGNIIGGIALVTAINHGQVIAGESLEDIDG